MCPVSLRAGLAVSAMLVPVLCFAQPGAVDAPSVEEKTTGAASSGSSSPEAIPTPPPDVSLNIIDHKLALSLAVDTWGQIAANERALESAASEALRALIAHRLETQRAFAALLDDLTDGRTTLAIEDAQREIAADAASTKTKVVRFRPLALHKNATAMMVRIRLEILNSYLSEVQSGLAARTGSEFDQYFLQGDVMHQMQLLAMLEVFERQASADFAGVLQQEVKAAREHLARSRQLLMQMEPGALAGSSALDAPGLTAPAVTLPAVTLPTATVPTAAIPLEQR